MRKIIIGDVHGCYDELMELLEKVSFDKTNDQVVFLGDYLDRGPKPIEVFNFIKELKSEMGDRCTLLYGNHEDFMRIWCADKRRGATWLSPNNGGEDTVKRLMAGATEGADTHKVVSEYSDWFLNHTKFFYEDDDMYCVHAMPYPNMAEAVEKYGYDAISEMVWCRDYVQRGGEEGAYDGKFTFVGHTPYPFPVLAKDHTLAKAECDKLYDLPKSGILDIDTGCVYFGILTAAVVEDGKYQLTSVGELKRE